MKVDSSVQNQSLKKDDFSVHSLQNFFAMCKHMAKKFCKEWTEKRKFIKKMRLRKMSNNVDNQEVSNFRATSLRVNKDELRG